MGPAWYPKAKKVDQGTTGGTMIGGKAHATLHSTETNGWAGAQYYHMVVNEVSPGVVEARQYRPFNKAAKSLRNLAGGVQTNRQGTVHIQVSVVARAKDAPNGGAWTPAIYAFLAEFAVWCEQEWGIPRTVAVPQTGGGSCYGYGSPCRFSHPAWKQYSGWSAHQNAPENTHWDCGRFDWNAMMTGTGLPPVPPVEEDNYMYPIRRGDGGAANVNNKQEDVRHIQYKLKDFGVDVGTDGLADQATLDAIFEIVGSPAGGSYFSGEEGRLFDLAWMAAVGTTPDLSAYATKADVEAASIKL